MDKKVAEFIGIMLGDGHIGIYNCKCGDKIKKCYITKVTLDSRNKQYTNHISNLMEEVLGTKPYIYFRKNENTVDVRICKKDEVLYVINKLGLKVSPKWNKMRIPFKFIHNNLSLFVLKGLFDTDGCLSVYNNNGIVYPRIEIKICPSPAQNQVVNILKLNKFNYTIQNLDKNEIRIRISGKKELKKWFNLVGSSNEIHVKKAEQFLNN